MSHIVAVILELITIDTTIIMAMTNEASQNQEIDIVVIVIFENLIKIAPMDLTADTDIIYPVCNTLPMHAH